MEFSIFDHVYDAVVIYSRDGEIVYCNHSFSALTGISPNRMIGKSDLSKVFVEIEGHPVQLRDFTTIDESTNIRVIKFKTRSVENGLGQFSLALIPQGDKELILFVMRDLSVEEDLHKKYRREMSLKDKKIEEMNSLIQLLQRTRLVKEPRKILEEFLKHILSQFGLATGFVKDIAGEVFRVNSKAQIDFATSDERLVKFLKERGSLSAYTHFSGAELFQLQQNGGPLLHSLVGVPMKSNQKVNFEIFIPFVSGERASTFDHELLTTLAQQMSLIIDNMTLEKLSIYDDLTKLHNARFFREKLDEFTQKYKVLSLILMDIDFFKKVNDSFGHLGGDAVLMTVGRLIKDSSEALGRENFSARVGGEEFAVLLPDKTTDQAVLWAEQLGNAVRGESIRFDDKNIKVTMSFGVADWIPGRQSVREFYKRADQALYDSKKNGRDRVTVLKMG